MKPLPWINCRLIRKKIQELFFSLHHILCAQCHQGTQEAWLKQQVTGECSARAFQSTQAFQHAVHRAWQFVHMCLGQGIQRLAGLQGQDLYFMKRKRLRNGRAVMLAEVSLELLNALIDSLDLLDIGQQRVVENTGHGMAGNVAKAGALSAHTTRRVAERAIALAQETSLWLPHADRQNFVRPQMYGR